MLYAYIKHMLDLGGMSKAEEFGMDIKLAGLFAGLYFVLGVSMAHAGPIIYDSNVLLGNGVGSDLSNGTAVAEDFVLQAGANTIADIHWTGGYFEAPASSDNFTIQIFDDNAGQPGAILHNLSNIVDAGRVDTGVDLAVYSIFAYWIDIAPLDLSAGDTYWLSIFNTTSPDERWFWGSNASGGNAQFRFFQPPDPDPGWETVDYTMDFQLTGPSSIPEPTTLALMGLGLAGIGYGRRRSKKVA